MIDSDEVLHVAELARLSLRQEEIEPMAHELSAVLDHIAKISEIDLEGVPESSHVIDVKGALRADLPTECLPREVVLAQAPSATEEGFLVPSPAADG